MKKRRLFLTAGLLTVLLLLLCFASATAARADTPKPAKSADEWAKEGYTVVYLEDAFGPDEEDGILTAGYFVLRKDIHYLTEKKGGGTAVNGNSFTRSGYQEVQAGSGDNAKMYCIQHGDRFYFGHTETEANGDTILLKDMVSINKYQYSPNVTPYTVGAWIDWRVEFKAEIQGVPFFGDGYFQVFLDHTSVDPGAWEPTLHTIEYYNGIHFERIGIKSDDEVSEDYDVGLISIKHAVGMVRLRLTLSGFWGELSFDADALEGVELTFKSYGPVFWDWAAIPHPKNGLTINKVSRANSYGGVQLSINAGPKVSAEWLLIDDMELDIGLIGVWLAGANNGQTFSPAGDDYKYHTCVNCNVEKLSSVIGPLKFIIDLVGLDPKTLIDIDAEDLGELYQFYYSKDLDECGEGTCPHYAYHTYVHVTNQHDSSPLKNVKVGYRPNDMDCSPYDKATTGSDGKADVYMKPGQSYYLTAELESPLDPKWVVSKEIMMHKEESTDHFEIALDIPTKTVCFKNTGSGDPEGWPEDVSFSPFLSREVILPDAVPEISGRQFAGWNTKEDGTGTSYAPGAKLTLNDDLTLWAQWKTPGTIWYVVYNARGGTKAPGPQEVTMGKDAVLTKEVPESSTMVFKGWTPDPQKDSPVYQPGDTLKYDSRKNYVVLYAMWELSPVAKPIHISFKANSLQEAVVPADAWLEQAAWLRLEAAEPAFGSAWAFIGWSEDPKAKTPEYQAGRSYYFSKDTVLYAIWEKQDTMTLTFRDSASDPAEGIPGPITILPSMSRSVRIPDRIPEKSGRSFAGWNTAKDGSGKAFAPGAVITLTEDTTLWAQWTIPVNSWYVVYNANGGTKAPGPQVFPKGSDAVLTKELPENEGMVFTGWTTDPLHPDPVYKPGDTLRYDPQKGRVTLYALWELNPAKRPALVTFDANGGRLNAVPRTMSVPKSVWVHLPEEEPAWDGQHGFLGWSRDPEAARAEMKPGSVAVFEKDTKLFAVWNAHYQVTEGAGSVWTKGSTAAQRFVADGNITYFTEFRIDGKRFTEGVEITSGSTVAVIKPWAMQKLSAGTHTVTFVYEDGEASATFTVKQNMPPTGDAGRPALWLGLLLCGTAGLILAGRRRHRGR